MSASVNIVPMELHGQYPFNPDFSKKIKDLFDLASPVKTKVHQYESVYAHIFADKTVTNFLQIGIWGWGFREKFNSDLTAWARLFRQANIYGGDKEEIPEQQKPFAFPDLNDRIKTCFVDQEVPASFNALKEAFDVEFDVIIDDASHIYTNTIITFEALFSVLKDDGVYLIEGIQDAGEGQFKWQQTLVQLEAYMTAENHTYKVFQSLPPSEIEDQAGLPQGTYLMSDSYILCVYK